jgi:hypothetical protein
MIEVPLAAWTALAGSGFTFSIWGVKHFLHSQRAQVSTRQQLDDHLKECDERYVKTDNRMDTIDRKLDDVSRTASRAEGKLDVIIHSLNGKTPS